MTKWHQENREYCKAQGRAWYYKNREHSLATSEAWRKRNPGKSAKMYKDWSARNKAHLTAYKRQRRKENRELFKAAEDRRRKRRNASGYYLKPEVRRQNREKTAKYRAAHPEHKVRQAMNARGYSKAMIALIALQTAAQAAAERKAWKLVSTKPDGASSSRKRSGRSAISMAASAD